MADHASDDLSGFVTSRADVNGGTSGSMQQVDWGRIDDYWRENHAKRPYAQQDRDYDYYRSAYEYGTRAAGQHRGRQWNDVEGDLERGWEETRGASRSTWQEMKDAVRDAWDRVTGHHRARTV